jgi:hypothetical protein
MNGRTTRHLLIASIGVISAIPTLYFWGAMIVMSLWKANVPGDPSLILGGILLSIPVSIVLAMRSTKWMFVITGIAFSTWLIVGVRLH